MRLLMTARNSQLSYVTAFIFMATFRRAFVNNELGNGHAEIRHSMKTGNIHEDDKTLKRNVGVVPLI
jgi:hypothetical protein